jgi:hypothetical protein
LVGYTSGYISFSRSVGSIGGFHRFVNTCAHTTKSRCTNRTRYTRA